MRMIRLGTHLTAEMDDSGNWTSRSAEFSRLLNRLTQLELARVYPADGDPVSVVFMRMVGKFNPVEAVMKSSQPVRGEIY